jgi:signal transduction histidine kinase
VNYFLADGDGLSFLKSLFRLDPAALAVMTTGLGNEKIACQAMRLGAYDYIVKGRSYYQDLPGIVKDLIDRHAKTLYLQQADRLKVRLAAQSELSGWLDHNFRNIFSAISGSLNLIDFQNPQQSQEKRREYVSDGLNSLKTAIKLLEDLNRMTVDKSGESEGRRILISSVVDDAWRAVRTRLLEASGEEFSVSPIVLDNLIFINDTRDLPPQIIAHQDLLTIFEALFKNALEALGQTPEPRVVVGVKRQDEFLVFTVSDNGCGMDEKVQRHAFEPLFSTKGQVGVGLSLTIVMALVTRHQGEVKVASSQGRGSTFEFTFSTNIV